MMLAEKLSDGIRGRDPMAPSPLLSIKATAPVLVQTEATRDEPEPAVTGGWVC